MWRKCQSGQRSRRMNLTHRLLPRPRPRPSISSCVTGNHNANGLPEAPSRIIRAFPPGSAPSTPRGLQTQRNCHTNAHRCFRSDRVSGDISQAKPTLRGAIKNRRKNHDRFGNACLDADVGEVAVPVLRNSESGCGVFHQPRPAENEQIGQSIVVVVVYVRENAARYSSEQNHRVVCSTVR